MTASPRVAPPMKRRRGHFDVIVSAAGSSGCALAAALADGRGKILVLEARQGKNPRFNGELIHPHGVDVLDERGFLGAAARGRRRRRAAASRSCRVPAQPTTVLPYGEIPGSRPFGFAIDHHDLVDTLRRKIARAAPASSCALGERVIELVRDQERVVGVMTAKGADAGAAGARLRRAPFEDPHAHRDGGARDAAVVHRRRAARQLRAAAARASATSSSAPGARSSSTRSAPPTRAPASICRPTWTRAKTR